MNDNSIQVDDTQITKISKSYAEQILEKLSSIYMKRYIDPNLPTKTFCRNLDSVEAKTTNENELFFSPTNWIHFSHQHKTGQEVSEGRKTIRVRTNFLLVTPLIWRYVLLKFLKLTLPQVLSIVTHIFNIILTTFLYPAGWKTSKIIPIAKKRTKNQAICRLTDPSGYSQHSPKQLKLLWSAKLMHF
jgi:hypothetical protein